MKKPKPVVIKWIDSVGPSGGYWRHLDDWDPRPPTLTTRGFLIRETKTYIVIASSVAAKGHDVSPGGLISIPKIAVISRDDK